MTLSKFRHKLFAGIFGMLVGASLLGLTPSVSAVNILGLGGTIATVSDTVYGTVTGGGSAATVVDVPAVGSCTGTCVTYAQDGYIYHAFLSSGTFTPPTGTTTVEALLVGGGGGGGGGQYGGGGGGAGGVRAVSGIAVTAGVAATITVGNGGAGGSTSTTTTAGNGSNGTDSSIVANAITTSASGGGGGGRGNATTAAPLNGAAGGSGGGGGADDGGATHTGGTGDAGAYTPDEGTAGGSGTTSGTAATQRGGGGGGAGGAGATGTAGTGGAGGAGGVGTDMGTDWGRQFGHNGWFGGGGGGGKRISSATPLGGAGGRGGGGNGGLSSTNGGNGLRVATDGMPNTGGGGGGGGNGNGTAAGGDGGTGIVIVRYIPPSSGTQRVVHVFTSSGTFTAPPGLTDIDVLVVGGGGGGGSTISAATAAGGGGGGGQYIYTQGRAISPSTSYTITVGAGGTGAAGTSTAARQGASSIFDVGGTPITATGGGGGAGDANTAGGAGGSGGGGRGGGAGGAADAGGGANAGGAGIANGSGGGGGGAGAAGSVGLAPVSTGIRATGGASGYGEMNVISGTPVSYGGGGGGGAYTNVASTVYGGNAGAGGGGLGGATTTTTDHQVGGAASANTGGGGGGASGSSGTDGATSAGGAGGSGIVIISYVAPTVDYVTHTFSVANNGQPSGNFYAPPGVSSVEVLVVGGGGGGGSAVAGASAGAGGGGAGGLVYNAGFAVTPLSAIAVTVGAGGGGGAIGNNKGSNGGNSIFSSLQGNGGGGGAGVLTSTSTGAGNSGGSGGGSRGGSGGTSNQGGGGFGFRGGNYTPVSSGDGASGGGGAGGTGGDDALNSGIDPGTAGGVGRAYSISGTNTFYAGGGGGGAGSASAVAAGGNGGGGAGSNSSTNPIAGTDGLGGGGGGGNGVGSGKAGADGGDGVVIVRYRPPTMTISTQPAAGTDFDVGETLSNIVVSLRSATGAIITTATNIVASVASPGTVSVGGTSTVGINVGTGDATFSNLQLNTAATGPLATVLRFSIANTSGTEDSNSLDLQTFYVEIDHGTNYGVCFPSTPITLRIERTGTNTTVTNFAGAINVTNSGNHGNYAAQANLTNEGGNDGTATYTFTGAQNGTVTLAYSTTTQGNITFSASGTNIPLLNYTGMLDVGPCEFRIDTDLNGTVCNAESVAISITDEAGTLATDYTGQVTLSTSTSVGSWANGDGLGTFVAGGGDGGATYTFHDNDNGNVVLNFFHPQTGTVDINVASVIGGYVDNESFDEMLTIGACTNTAQPWQQVCSDTTNTVNIDVPAAGTDRLLLVTTHRTGNLGFGTEAMTYNGVDMTLIQEAEINSGAADVQTQIYGMLDSELPAAGTYTVVAEDDGNMGVCAFVYQNIAQNPLPTTAPLADGAIDNNNGVNIAISTIVTAAANSLVVSAASGRLAPNDTRNWDDPPDVADSDLTDRLYSSSTTAAVTFGVSAGIIATAGAIDIEEEHDGADTVRRTQVAAAFSPAAPALNSFQITHSGTGSTCVSTNAITIKAVDQYGNTLTSYVGTVNLDAGATGDWYQGTATNAVVDVTANDGDATYTFAAGDAGVATLYFGRSTSGSVNFNVNDGSIVENVFFDASMNMAHCTFRVSHEGASGSTCQSNLITIGVYDATGSLITDYAGLVTLRSAVPVAAGNGNWTAYDATNPVIDTVTNDGEATYQFSALDGGDIVLAFSKTTASTVNFTITAANSMVIDAGYDPDLTLLDCRFRIDHDDDGDSTAEVCMPESIKFTVVNTGGTVQTRYAGTPNITVSDANGTWSSAVPAIAARLTDSGLGNGQASFTFNSSDAGEVTLRLMHHNSTLSSISINISAGGSFIEEAAYDPAITSVSGCKIRFSTSPPNITTCSISTVTLGIYNSANTLATEYAGTVSLTTSTNHGHWLSDNGPGTLTDGAPTTDGAATYTFVAADGGDAELKFTSTVVETLNFNASANSGAITVDTTDGPDAGTDPDYDPNMIVTPCLPTVAETACYQNQNQNQADAITLRSSIDTQGSRMLLVYIASNASVDTTGATIEGASQALTFLRTETASNGGDTKLHVYGILDANLPAAAGDYDVAFAGSSNSPAMCIVALEGAAQSFPSPTATLNGSVKNNDDTITTNLTTAQNNSIIVGVVANGQGGAEYVPAAFTAELWQDDTYDPAGGDWAGFYDYKLAAGAYAFVSDANFSPNRQAQIALAISPFVSGPAATTGYVPVSLFQTLSGNVNYRAIGSTLRTDPNGPFSCLMQNETTGSTATLTLPANSSVRYAYLYWAGSGYSNQMDQDVKFGIDGGSRPATNTADGTFVIAPNQVYNQSYPAVPEGFFGAYKNVTGLFPAYPAYANTSYTFRFSDLSVQVGSPWFDFQTCVGGWALVVMYENAIEPFQVINLFHGFQPFYHSAFTLVPRNFRMAKPDGATLPHAQITHITFEGDENIDDVGEVLQLQNDPFDTTSFDILSNAANPGAPSSPTNNQYNSTVSFPNYDINLVYNGTITSSATSYGTDIDTFYVEGDDMGELLEPFGAEEAEQITTRYSTERDIVLLMGEIISVTNSPIADLEITVTDSATPWKVNSTGGNSFIYTVKNNGDGALGGYANGDVIMTGELQTGLTINAITGTGWSCSSTADKFTCIFEIATEWTTARGAAIDGQLAMNESLPAVTVTVNIAADTTFQLLNNPVETIGRIAHVGEYYNMDCQGQGAAIGEQPNPNPTGGCDKPPQFDNVNDLNKYLVDIDDLDDKTATNNNVDGYIRNVFGVSTDLSITKSLVGILEANQPATYHLTVTNNGPDATTKTFTVTDTLPAGLVPSTASGTGWSCGIAGQLVTCTHAGSLAASASSAYIEIVTQPIVSPAVEGIFVFNTGTVSVGNYNIDTDALDNSHTIDDEVTGPVASATDRFLLSVNEDDVDLGSLNDFDEGDLVMYDPVAGTATMFLEEASLPATTNLGDIDALHVLPNGHIIMSTADDGSTIAGVTFNAEDLVLYDPLLKVATLIFDGSTIFASDTSDIDALHVLYHNSYDPKDWDLIISTTAEATIGATTFQDNDIVRYDMGGGAFGAGGTATVLEDGAGNDLFGNTKGDINSLYVRYNDTNKYILSSSDATTTVGLSGVNQQYEAGEQIEVDLTTDGDTQTDPLLCNNQTPCEGSPPATLNPGTAYMDDVHMVESGYFGHFSVSISAGNACSATTITIRKHVGLSHVVDTNYKGAVRISSSLGAGIWAMDATAKGTLYTTGFDLGAGEALYVFENGATGDDGEVILTLTDIDATNSFNVNVTNLIGVENNPTEDPTAVISDQVTPITYRDNFSAVAYNRNDGIAAFATSWSEANDDASASSGKIQIASNQLRFNNLGGSGPSLTRTIDFSGYTVDAQPVLTFDYSIAGNPSGSPNFVVEASDDGSSWSTLWSTTASSGSGASGNLSIPAPWAGTKYLRFRIASGYSGNATQYMNIDNVLVSTETHDCAAGSDLDHYAISLNSTTTATCLVSEVTISPHSVTDTLVQPGAGVTISLSAYSLTTASYKGRWGKPDGAGTFNAPLDNGQATYTFAVGEDEVTFPFYYTDVVGNSENVQFSLTDTNAPSKSNSAGETDGLTVAHTALRFFNETANNTTILTEVAGMRSDTYRPTELLTLQAVRSNPIDPSQCDMPFVGNVEVELAVECIDPESCSAGSELEVTSSAGVTTAVPGTSDINSSPAWQAVTLPFTNVDFGPGSSSAFNRAWLRLNFNDAGKIRLHARYNIPVEDENAAVIDSDDFMSGSSNQFVVRPFGYKIDFLGNDRQTNYDGDYDAVQSYAANASSPHVVATAGEGFTTTVSAVAWQAGDDSNNDGVPDAGARLFDNAVTPNYGNETVPNSAEDDIVISVALASGGGATLGTLTDNNLYTDFTNGVYSRTISYSEVGIIDLTADLLPSNADGYLDGGESITGKAYNVGRFIPDHFVLSVPMLTPRPARTPTSDPFTYFGEEFGVAFTLTAYNGAITPAVTQNYVGDFAKLRSTASPFSFYAVDDVTAAADVDYTLFSSSSTLCNGTNNNRRLCQATGNNVDITGDWTSSGNGVRNFSGRLILSRQLGEVEENPIDDMLIGVRVLDSDGVADAIATPIDLDDSADDVTDTTYNLIGEHTFRYGRIRLENGYGSEIANFYDDDNDDGTAEILQGHDVGVRFTAEYWDGTRFIINTDDTATDYVSNNTNVTLLDPDTSDALLTTDVAITAGTGKVLQGVTMETGTTDIPIYLRAPGANKEGQLVLELNLDNLGFHFLKYDWRSAAANAAPENGDVDPDGTTDNPRALVEFGTFRGNDRIINWQEIFK